MPRRKRGEDDEDFVADDESEDDDISDEEEDEEPARKKRKVAAQVSKPVGASGRAKKTEPRSKRDAPLSTRAPRKKKYLFEEELASMMYGMGDSSHPARETVHLMEDMLVDFVRHLTSVSAKIGARSLSLQTSRKATKQTGQKLQVEDLLFVLRHDQAKLARANQAIRAVKEQQRLKKAENAAARAEKAKEKGLQQGEAQAVDAEFRRKAQELGDKFLWSSGAVGLTE